MRTMLLLLYLLLSISEINSQVFLDECIDEGIFLNNMPACNNGDYYILFEDNFDSDSLDLSKWTLKAYGVGQQYGISPSQEFYTLDNMDISNGTCKLFAKKENIMGRCVSWKPNDEILEDGLPNYRLFNYTSSRLTAIHDICLYGKYEIRCRLPNGKGFWPSFWTYSGPRWNELDFFDNMKGNERYSCGLGYDFNGDGSAEGCRWGTNNIPDLSQWHTYTIYYDFDRIIWQIDNETIRTLYKYHTVTGLPVLCGDNISTGLYFQEISFPIDPMHIIIELAIRNDEDAPDENTVFPSCYEIDYVRYWVKPGQNSFLDSFIDKDILIHPNPASENIKVAYTLNYQSSISMSIFNMIGNEVLNIKDIAGIAGKNEQSIDMGFLPNGIYLIRIVANDEIVTKKFIISK